MKKLTAPDATAVNPPKRAKRRVKQTNPPRPRVITGRGWVA